MHSLGVAHQDLKPQNLLVDAMGKLRISDFGCGRMSPTGDNLIGGVKRASGTPGFAPPENYTGHFDGYASDIFSLGVTLFVTLFRYLLFKRDIVRGQPEHDLLHAVQSGAVATMATETLRPIYDKSIPKERHGTDFDTWVDDVRQFKPDEGVDALVCQFWGRDARTWKRISPELRSLLNRMIALVPDKRPSMDDLRYHPWVLGKTAAVPQYASLGPGKRAASREADANVAHKVAQCVDDDGDPSLSYRSLSDVSGTSKGVVPSTSHGFSSTSSSGSHGTAIFRSLGTVPSTSAPPGDTSAVAYRSLTTNTSEAMDVPPLVAADEPIALPDEWLPPLEYRDAFNNELLT